MRQIHKNLEQSLKNIKVEKKVSLEYEKLSTVWLGAIMVTIVFFVNALYIPNQFDTIKPLMDIKDTFLFGLHTFTGLCSICGFAYTLLQYAKTRGSLYIYPMSLFLATAFMSIIVTILIPFN